MIDYIHDRWIKTLAAPHGSFSTGVLWRVFIFGFVAAVTWVLDRRDMRVAIPIGVHEVSGAVIALTLAFRTNTAYQRFWEGRTLWGAIVNASRNLARILREHAPPGRAENAVVWIAVFAHACRRSLREQDDFREIEHLLGRAEMDALRAQGHMALASADRLSRAVAELARGGAIEPLMAQLAEREVGDLVDCLGGCERIKATPTPLGYVMLARRCIVLFLMTLPMALVGKIGIYAVLVTMIAAYPVLMIEALANELDDPFGHDENDLPLSRICMTIERNVLGRAQPLPIVTAEEDIERATGRTP